MIYYTLSFSHRTMDGNKLVAIYRPVRVSKEQLHPETTTWGVVPAYKNGQVVTVNIEGLGKTTLHYEDGDFKHYL